MLSIQDLLQDNTIVVQDGQLISLVLNLIDGMLYLHDSKLEFHGNLKSTNCLVDAHGILKISDFGLNKIRVNAFDENDINQRYLSIPSNSQASS